MLTGFEEEQLKTDWLALDADESLIEGDQRIITAEPGDNVTLPCRVPFPFYGPIDIEWSKTDQKSDQVVFFQSYGWVEDKLQSPSFRNRVHLLYRRNRDVSLVLENVTTDDTGTYECRVEQGLGKRRKRSILETQPISIINLIVDPGNQDGLKEDGRSKIGMIIPLVIRVFFIVVIPAVVVSALCRRSRDSSPRSNRPPAAAADAEETLTGLDE